MKKWRWALLMVALLAGLMIMPAAADVTIPADTTEIDDYAFYQNAGLTGKLTIPYGVQRIGEYAFAGCTGLRGTVVIPETVTSLADTAFDSTGLTVVYNADLVGLVTYTIADGEATITGLADTTVTDLVLPASIEGCPVTAIAPNAFKNKGTLTSVVLPGQLRSIGASAFAYCTKLTGEIVFPQSLTSIGALAFYDCALTGDLVLPAGLTEMGKEAFCSVDIASVTLPQGLKALPEGAFRSCLLSSISFGGVQSIGARAFNDCNYLTSLELPDTLTSIGAYAFGSCDGLTGTLKLPASLVTLGESAFSYCGLQEVVFNEGLTVISDNAFEYCASLERITLPSTLQEIGSGAFRNDKLLSGELHLPASLTRIGANAFYYCQGLTGALEIPDATTFIGSYAFSRCKGFTSLTLGAGLGTLSSNAFEYCFGLTGKMELPLGLRTLGVYAFQYCTGYEAQEVLIPYTVDSFSSSAFFGTKLTYSRPVTPEDLFEKTWYSGGYMITGYLGGETDVLFIPVKLSGSTVTGIGEGAFDGMSGLTGSVVLGSGIKTVGANAFRGCSSLDGTLSLNSGLTSIGESAFEGCANLKGTVTLYAASVGANAFKGCASLTGPLTLKSGVKTIGAYAFDGCSGLTGALTLPNTVTSIGEGAFRGCSGFTGALTFSASMTEVPPYAFRGCSGISALSGIHAGVTRFDEYSFSRCTGLNGELTLPETLSYVADTAFDGTSVILIHDPLPIVDFTFRIENGEVTVTGYSGDGSEPLVIPEKLKDYPVRYIAANAFDGCTTLRQMPQLPSTLREIGDYAFRGCVNMTGEATLPEGLTKLGFGVFYNCTGLSGDVVIPDTVTDMGSYTFYGCSGLNGTVTLSANATELGGHFFAYCSGLSGTITIPEHYTTLGIGAFAGCSGLTGAVLPSGTTAIPDSLFWNCRSLKNFTIPSQCAMIGTGAFYNCVSLTGTLKLPETMNTLGANAFSGCTGFDALVMNDNLFNPGNYAFQGCTGLKSVRFSTRMDLINEGVFQGCTGLTGELILPESIRMIRNAGFADCTGLTKVTLPEGFRTLMDRAFAGCTAMVDFGPMPASIESIGYGVFNGCPMPGVVIDIPPETKVGYMAWEGCGATIHRIVGGVSINQLPETVYLTSPRKTLQLSAACTPEDASQEVIWSTSDASLATIDANGLLTMRGAGTVTITATSADTPTVSASVELVISGVKVNYRALVIGNTYSGTDLALKGCDNDAYGMTNMLKRMSSTSYGVNCKVNVSASSMLNAVSSVLGNQTENDVSLFYYSGHGVMSVSGDGVHGALVGNDGKIVPLASLKAALDKIPGRKIIILDSCHSGEAIGKSVGAQDGTAQSISGVTPDGVPYYSDPAAFNSQLMMIFGAQDRGGEMDAPGYYVITAASRSQESYSVTIDNTYVGAFTYYLCQGCGYDTANKVRLTSMPADTDGNGYITLQEAYAYAYSKALTYGQRAQINPAGSQFIIWGE